jgi:hypothetical protein
MSGCLRPWSRWRCTSFPEELQNYPEAELVDAHDGEQYVRIRTHNGNLMIDAEEPGQKVHVSCPLATIDDVSRELATLAPAS